jgi:hypothetical protein
MGKKWRQPKEPETAPENSAPEQPDAQPQAETPKAERPMKAGTDSK